MFADVCPSQWVLGFRKRSLFCCLAGSYTKILHQEACHGSNGVGIRVYDQNIVFLCLILYINPIKRQGTNLVPTCRFSLIEAFFHSDSESIYGNRVKFKFATEYIKQL